MSWAVQVFLVIEEGGGVGASSKVKGVSFYDDLSAWGLSLTLKVRQGLIDAWRLRDDDAAVSLQPLVG